MDYIVAGAILRAQLYSVPAVNDRAAIKEMVMKVKVPVFTPKSGVKIDVTEAEANASNNEGQPGEWGWLGCECVYLCLCLNMCVCGHVHLYEGGVCAC